MRGSSPEEVAERILNHTNFPGLQGPTVSPVYTKTSGSVKVDYYAIIICVPKPKLYHAVRQLRKAGGSGVLVSPLTYIFDEETPRYRQMLDALKAWILFLMGNQTCQFCNDDFAWVKLMEPIKHH
jgi:ATP phosphoribosyltransferase